ncbi:MAG: flagellar hook-length control protein [Sphingomonas bacterium]|nr:flagellar hook-length control protein [Sphingomonas bacterium]
MIPAGLSALRTPIDAPEPAAAAPERGGSFALLIDSIAPDVPADAAPAVIPAVAEEVSDVEGVAEDAATSPPAVAAALIAQLCPTAPVSLAPVPPAPASPPAAPSPAPFTAEVTPGTPIEPPPVLPAMAALPPAPADKPTRPGKATHGDLAGRVDRPTMEAIAPATAPALFRPVAAIAPADGLAVQLAPAPAAATAAPGEIVIRQQLDLIHDSAWLDQLARDITRSADQDGRLRFSLAPDNLGRLTVDLARGVDGTAIRLTTETEQAQRILADAQPRLIAEARAQGLRVTETQVDLDQRPGGQPQQPGGGWSGGSDGDRPRHYSGRADIRPALSRVAAAEMPAARDLYA